MNTTSRQLVVVAAAGAGKTRVLVERYLKHIREDGYSPDEILTITFTRKAAAEMKRRIVQRLREYGLFEQAQIAETGPIQTIHGFCERLLRENSLEAGLDPEYEVISESQASRLRDLCIRDALSAPPEEFPWIEDLLTELAGERDGRDDNTPHAKLESAIREVLSTLRGSGYDVETLLNRHVDPDSTLLMWQNTMLDSMPEQIREAWSQQPAGEGFFERLRRAHKEAGVRMPRWLAAKVDPVHERKAAEQASGLMGLVGSAWNLLEQRMWERQELDFVSMEARAVRLLQRSEITRQRLRTSYRMVMVDEAQDVNPVQNRLLEALALDYQMLVGDAQQSIYGFRQADVRLFIERAAPDRSTRLSRNYRSREGILRFVDTLFGRLWGQEYVPMSEPPKPMDFEESSATDWGGVEFWYQKDIDTRGVARYVGELSGEGVPLKDIAVLVRGLRYATILQESLRQEGIPARIAGGSERFYTRLEIRDLANCLQALADRHDNFALAATLRSPFADLSLDSIGLLALANKETPIFGSLREFQPPVSADREKLDRFLSWFEPLSEYADRLPAWEVLAEVFAKSGYLEHLALRKNADQLLANVRKLLSLASSEPDLGPSEYAEQIREIQNLRHREGDAPAEDDEADIVTIMTIHKAKGLEFPVVVVPETHRRQGLSLRSVEIEPRLGIVVPKFAKVSAPYHGWIGEMRRSREAEEEHRVLYVALTRAKSRLCMCVHPQARQRDSFARLIPTTVGLTDDAPKGAVVRRSQDIDDLEE